MTRDCPKF